MRTFTISVEPFPGTLARWRIQGELAETGAASRVVDERVDFEFVRSDDHSDAVIENRELVALAITPRKDKRKRLKKYGEGWPR